MVGRVVRNTVLGSLAIIGLYPSLPSGPFLRDFACFVLAGRAVLAGQPPYAPLNTWGYPNLAAPILLPAFALLARFDALTAYQVWYVVQLALFVALVALLAWQYPAFRGWRILWLFSLAGVWQTLWLGNFSVPLALATVGGWCLLGKRPAFAGVLVGVVVALKPTLALWPLLLLASGEMVTVVVAAIVAGVLTIIPAVAYGPLIYRDWLRAGSAQPARHFPFGAFDTAGLSTLDVLGIVAMILVAVVVVVRYRPNLHTVSTLGLGLSLYLLPWTGLGYLLLLLPAFGRRWNRPLTLAAAIFAVPWIFQQTGTLVVLNYLDFLGVALVLVAQPIITTKLRAVLLPPPPPAAAPGQRFGFGALNKAKGEA